MTRLPRPLAWSRLLLLALLLLGIVVAPVLAAIGGTHDLFHDAAAGAHVHEASDLDTDGRDDGAAAGLMHAAMHCATCGGHTAALPAALAPVGPACAQSFEAPEVEAALAGRPDTLLRPPISA